MQLLKSTQNKILKSFFIFLILVHVGIEGQSQTVKEGYDKFKGIRFFYTEKIASEKDAFNWVSMDASAFFPENGKTSYFLKVESYVLSSNTGYPNAIMLIDGQRQILGTVTGRRSYSSNIAIVSQSFDVGIDVIRRIAKARIVEIQIGSVEVTLNSKVQSAFTELLQRVETPTRSSPVAPLETFYAVLPDEADSERIVQTIIQEFTDGVESGTFNKLYLRLSKRLRKESTLDDVKRTFQTFINDKSACVPLFRSTGKLYPNYSPAPNIDGKQLRLSGQYIVGGNTARFDFRFVVEKNTWMLDYVDISAK